MPVVSEMQVGPCLFEIGGHWCNGRCGKTSTGFVVEVLFGDVPPSAEKERLRTEFLDGSAVRMGPQMLVFTAIDADDSRLKILSDNTVYV